MRQLIVWMVITQMILAPVGPSASASSEPKIEQRDTNVILKLLNDEVTQNAILYADPTELSASAVLENKLFAMSQIQELANKVKDTSYSLTSLKEETIRLIEAESEFQVIRLREMLDKTSIEKLDEMFAASMKKGFYPESYWLDYQSAYFAKEKREIILNLAKADLFQLKSGSIKRIGLLKREGLIKELSVTQSFLNTKGDDTWKIVLVVVLTVAVAGLVSWAIVSSTQKSYEKKVKKAKEENAKNEEDLKNQYANKETELQATFEERARLREEGYVWTICSTREQVVSANCSYDYSMHSGMQTCITRCLKNPTTGDAVMQEESCTSAFIPSNCFVTNPYTSGFNSGYSDGHDKGYSTGYDRAYNDAYNDYYDTGYDRGYQNGYDRGYNAGYSDGVREAEYDASTLDGSDDTSSGGSGYTIMAVSNKPTEIKTAGGTVDTVKLGFNKGYREGYAVGSLMLVGEN